TSTEKNKGGHKMDITLRDVAIATGNDAAFLASEEYRPLTASAGQKRSARGGAGSLQESPTPSPRAKRAFELGSGGSTGEGGPTYSPYVAGRQSGYSSGPSWREKVYGYDEKRRQQREREEAEAKERERLEAKQRKEREKELRRQREMEKEAERARKAQEWEEQLANKRRNIAMCVEQPIKPTISQKPESANNQQQQGPLENSIEKVRMWKRHMSKLPPEEILSPLDGEPTLSRQHSRSTRKSSSQQQDEVFDSPQPSPRDKTQPQPATSRLLQKQHAVAEEPSAPDDTEDDEDRYFQRRTRDKFDRNERPGHSDEYGARKLSQSKKPPAYPAKPAAPPDPSSFHSRIMDIDELLVLRMPKKHSAKEAMKILQKQGSLLYDDYFTGESEDESSCGSTAEEQPQTLMFKSRKAREYFETLPIQIQHTIVRHSKKRIKFSDILLVCSNGKESRRYTKADMRKFKGYSSLDEMLDDLGTDYKK
uniref:Tub domain-containing protein n=1 Tax=Macrostomum lignano TaxID=282301 RepID=A0A1I8J9E1_9PLAT